MNKQLHVGKIALLKEMRVYLVLILLFGSASVYAATKIDQKPLTGINLSYGTNVMLTPSIEWPTAGPAYRGSKGNGFNYMDSVDDLEKTYLGYFDPEKCYIYDDAKGYFTPVSKAMTESYDGKTLVGLCNNTPQTTDQFSGNILNRFTMSSLDIFRQTMTGGNRALGTESNRKNYADADSKSLTVLRRSYVDNEHDPKGIYKSRDWCKETNYWKPAKDLSSVYLSLPNRYMERLLPRKFLRKSNEANFESQVFLEETAFSLRIKKAELMNSLQPDRGYRSKTCNDTNGSQEFTVAVQVCKADMPEENCHTYPDGSLKPVGIIQDPKYKDMRFGVASYIANDGKNVFKTAIRAKMRNVFEGLGSSGHPEVNAQTGQFIVNPDGVTDVNNSGVINFVNKFGDKSGYVTWDQAAELYYTAMRYLRHGGRDTNGQPNGIAPYLKNYVSEKEKDGFPVIYDWDDPLKSDFPASKTTQGRKNERQQMCRSNAIVFLGDTNTWYDAKLPNFVGKDSSPNDDDIQTAKSVQGIFDQDGQDGGWDSWDQSGGGSYIGAMAGLSSWGNTKDNRPDLNDKQTIKSFFIDVVEQGNYKNNHTNSYALAAKYGSFDDKNGNGKPDLREEWTDDPEGNSTISAFWEGVPKGYAAANNPESMVKALKETFKKVNSAKKNVEQSELGLSAAPNTVLDLDKDQTVIASTFNGNNWTGDVTAYGIKPEGGKGDEKWSAATKLNEDFFHKANSKDADAYLKRHIFTNDMAFSLENLSAIKTRLALEDGQDAGKLIAYTMGKQSDVNYLRHRDSLLGTVVNSSVVPILPPDDKARGLSCRFANRNAVKNRPLMYAFAANDGMLHFLDKDGKEQAAYIPSTVLPELKKYASINYEHFYMNDATPTVKDICIDGTAKTILVGSTGRGEARTIYALDVTDTSGKITHKNLLWEYHSPHLGQTTGKVSVAMTADGQPIVVTGSGYNNSDNVGYVIILDAKIGQEKQLVKLGKSGVGEVFVETNSDQQAEFIFVGDQSGKLWQLNYDETFSNWKLAYGSSVPLFTPSEPRPIYAAPIAKFVRGKHFVSFGTGNYLRASNINTTDTNYGYGLFIKDRPINESDLIKQKIQVNTAESIGKKPDLTLYRSTQEKGLSGTESAGWRVQLLPGQNITDRPLILRNRLVQFTAVRENDRLLTCTISGSTAILVVDINTGAMPDYPVFDTDRNGKVDRPNGKSKKDDGSDGGGSSGGSDGSGSGGGNNQGGDGQNKSGDKIGSMIEVNGVVNPDSTYVRTTKGDFVVVGGVWFKMPDFAAGNIIRINYREVAL